MQKAAYIYGLYSPDGELRYIGKTIRKPSERLNGHIGAVSSAKTFRHCLAWIKSLLSLGLRPQVRVMEICEPNLANEREQAHIALFRRLGCRLTNLTDGGEGLNNPNDATREKLRSAKVGNQYHLGFKHSEDSKEKMRTASLGNKNCVGRFHSLESKEKNAAAHRGKSLSFEHRKRIGRAVKGKNLGRTSSESARQRMSIAQFKRQSEGRDWRTLRAYDELFEDWIKAS